MHAEHRALDTLITHYIAGLHPPPTFAKLSTVLYFIKAPILPSLNFSHTSTILLTCFVCVHCRACPLPLPEGNKSSQTQVCTSCLYLLENISNLKIRRPPCSDQFISNKLLVNILLTVSTNLKNFFLQVLTTWHFPFWLTYKTSKRHYWRWRQQTLGQSDKDIKYHHTLKILRVSVLPVNLPKLHVPSIEPV